MFNDTKFTFLVKMTSKKLNAMKAKLKFKMVRNKHGNILNHVIRCSRWHVGAIWALLLGCGSIRIVVHVTIFDNE